MADLLNNTITQHLTDISVILTRDITNISPFSHHPKLYDFSSCSECLSVWHIPAILLKVWPLESTKYK